MFFVNQRVVRVFELLWNPYSFIFFSHL
jgi:hypothetical protein